MLGSSESFSRRCPQTAEILETARADVFPDYAVGVFHAGKESFGYGGCGGATLFDLASLTKVIVTTTLAAIADERGVLGIDRSVSTFFQAFKSDPRVLVSHLLNHTSGLPAWLPLHSRFHDVNSRGSFDPRRTPREARMLYEEEIIRSHVPAAFERQAVYSDLGFLLLGWALEKVVGLPLDALFQEWVLRFSALDSLQFLPTSPDVAPTENCPWRGHVLRGEVHDDNCFVLGGVAGHAGLFGNARDVLAMGRIWLDSFHGRKSPIPGLTPFTVRKFWTLTHVPKSARVLGWDGVTPGASSTGRHFSLSSRGHLGFTGTSLWIDPEKELAVTLLTNRVHPSRSNEKIKAFRSLFHDTLIEEMGLT